MVDETATSTEVAERNKSVEDATKTIQGLLNALPERRAQAVAFGLSALQALEDERDQLRGKVSDQTTEIATLRSQIEVLQQSAAFIESRNYELMIQRDQAIAERAVYETLFASFQAQLERFEVPATVLTPKNGKRKGAVAKDPADSSSATADTPPIKGD